MRDRQLGTIESDAGVSGSGAMSLYEVLDRFVATGVLACAGLVGAEIETSAPFDIPAFSARIRKDKLNEPFGAALDALAHTLWFASERHGIPLSIAEQHSNALTGLLQEVRFAPGEAAQAFAAAGSPNAVTPGARLAALWLAKATAHGALARAGLDPEVCNFILSEMLAIIVDRTALLSTLAPALLEHRTSLSAVRPAASAMIASAAPQIAAASLPDETSALSNLSRPRPVLVAPSEPAQVQSPAHAEVQVQVPAPSTDVQARHRLPEGALRRLQQALAQQPMSSEQRLARLDDMAAWLISTVAFLRRQTNEAAAQRQAKLDAANALESGDFERAMEQLKLVREHTRESRRRTETRIAEELQALRQQMIEEAAATARLGELALARMDLEVAADHFADAAGQLPANEAALELEYRQKQAEALAARAETTGDMRVLQSAAQAFRKCRSLLAASGDTRLRLRINVGLGDMLVALGVRSKADTIELEEAAAAYTDAIEAVDRASKPMQWALVQLSHAAALVELGERRDRQHYWKLAAAALMPALDVFETRGADDLAEAARAKLRAIAGGIGQDAVGGLLSRPA